MKKNILMIVIIIAAQIAAFTIHAHSQYSNNIGNVTTIISDTIYKKEAPVLLADETTITYTKNTAKIECCNEGIAKIILQKWEQLITRYNYTRKKDRHGLYKQYNIYLNKDDASIIIKWAKTNL